MTGITFYLAGNPRGWGWGRSYPGWRTLRALTRGYRYGFPTGNGVLPFAVRWGGVVKVYRRVTGVPPATGRRPCGAGGWDDRKGRPYGGFFGRVMPRPYGGFCRSDAPSLPFSPLLQERGRG
jgi:hypothetical protein